MKEELEHCPLEYICDCESCCHSSGGASDEVYELSCSFGCGVRRPDVGAGLDEVVCEGMVCHGVLRSEEDGCCSWRLRSRAIVAWRLALNWDHLDACERRVCEFAVSGLRISAMGGSSAWYLHMTLRPRLLIASSQTNWSEVRWGSSASASTMRTCFGVVGSKDVPGQRRYFCRLGPLSRV